tara:strand:+ start:4255 stop:4548 length:294 start_codon:yes stop_codon:yes gene_type:complete
MDILQVIEQFGVPVAMTMAFGFFIWKQNNWIQDDLKRDLDEANDRFESIVIKLIDSQKQMQLEQKDIKASYRAIVEILAALSGNGLKERFLKNRDYE